MNNVLLKTIDIMTIKYEAPQLEVVEIEIEGAILVESGDKGYDLTNVF